MIPYGDLQYFGLVALLLLPAIIGGLMGKGMKWYNVVATALMTVLLFVGNHQWSIFAFAAWQVSLVFIYVKVRRHGNPSWLYYVSLVLSILPLLIFKVLPLLHLTPHGFLGVSYVTFRCAQIIIEIRDGRIQQLTLWDFLTFVFFFPTISSGPIDRYKRFMEDLDRRLSPQAYRDNLYTGTNKIFQGLLYKYIIGYLIQVYWMNTPAIQLKTLASTWSYMYAYSLYLFFDFAGYSALAIGVSYIVGIRTPENFNKPFLSRNIKDFWNRWHMTLSFWFRDYIYMRLVMFMTKKKVFKNRYAISYTGYLALFGIMGLWHGLQLHYIVYGLYMAMIMCAFDYIQRLNKKWGFWGDSLPWRCLSIIITFHFVCFGLLIFSGRLFI